MTAVIGTDGPDTLLGTTAAEALVGLGGDDTIRGGGGADSVLGGAGEDTLELPVGRSSFGVGSPAEGVLEISPLGGPGGSGPPLWVAGVERFEVIASNVTVTYTLAELLAAFGHGEPAPADWDALAGLHQANFAATGTWSLAGADSVPSPGGSGGGTPSPTTDWNALAAQAEANFAATGQWFL